jgi:quercetin dioxygenase-like cupin family protein
MSKPGTPEQYHNTDMPTYAEPTNGAYKQSDKMVEVVYEPSHFNAGAPEGKQGAGVTIGKWVFNEEPGKAEGILGSSLELFMDTTLEPNASIGEHRHSRTEEIYYLLEGSLEVELQTESGVQQFLMQPGDAHLIKPGQSHFIQAGGKGARLIVVAAGVTNG